MEVIMRVLIFFVTIAALSQLAGAQTVARHAQFDSAAEAFESGNYEQTIALLAVYEKSYGTSPRLESLRALAYRDLDKPKEAHQAILVYLRLTAKRDMSGSEAHQDMLKLRDEMLEAIEKKYKDDKEKLDEERDEEAKVIVDELEAIYRSPDLRRSSSSSPPAALKAAWDRESPGEYIGPPESAPKAAGPGMDALAELEMWRKISQSTVATEYFLFIESFPDGQFASIARKKMLEIGDPVWNEVKKSSDPFKYRDFIKGNPDSPFIDIAKVRMNELATVALEWEKVKDTRNEFVLSKFESRFPAHPFGVEVKKIRSEIFWRNVESSGDEVRLGDFLRLFPDSPWVPAARAKLEALRPTKPVATPMTQVTPAIKVVGSGAASNGTVDGPRNAAEQTDRLAKFNNVKFEVAENAFIWSEFAVIGPCTVKISVYNSVVTYPIKDEMVLDLSDIAAARAKKGRGWLVETDRAKGSIEITRTTYTRNPPWGQVKESHSFSLRSMAIAAFSDEATALELAREVEKLIVECKRP
jgi:hypothetical protein